MDIEKRLLAAFGRLQSVVERIDGEQPPNTVDIDHWTSADGAPAHLRGVPLVDRLVETVTFNDKVNRDSAQLLAGYRGTGKTTVLLQLRKRLADQGFVVIPVDAVQYHDVTADFTFETLLVSLAAAVGDAVRSLGPDVAAATTALTQRIRNLLGATVDLTKVVDLRGLQVALTSVPFSEQLRTRLSEQQGLLVEAFRMFFSEVIAGLHHARPVLLVDGLEKISAAIDETAKAYRRLTGIFVNHGAELAIAGLHVVYVVPPQCRLIAPNLNGYDWNIIPCVRLASQPPHRVRDEAGIAALTEVLAQRIEIDLFAPEALRYLVESSGGHLRTLLKLAAEVVKSALVRHGAGAGDVVPIQLAQARQTIAEFATLRRDTARGMRPVLAEVARTGDGRGVDANSVDQMAVALDLEHVILCRNGDVWYDVHPLVRSVLTEVAAL